VSLVSSLRGASKPRSSGLQGDRRWDAVIDVWPADFNMSQRSAELLKDRVGRYIYVSSISAYSPLVVPGATESFPLIAKILGLLVAIPADQLEAREQAGIGFAAVEQRNFVPRLDRGLDGRWTDKVGAAEHEDAEFPLGHKR
jgi:hypothetical protein